MTLRRRGLPEVPPPPPSPPAVAADAFVLCPLGWFLPLSPQLAEWQQALYQWAFAQAQELLRPSRAERDWLGVWN